jgi:hypothetical protein
MKTRQKVTFSALVFALTGAWCFFASPALATACMDEIVRLEQRLRDSRAKPADQPTGKQTVGAQLGHQPTPKSVAEADANADKAVQRILNRAKAFGAESTAGECQKEVAEARLHFAPE